MASMMSQNNLKFQNRITNHNRGKGRHQKVKPSREESQTLLSGNIAEVKKTVVGREREGTVASRVFETQVKELNKCFKEQIDGQY